jgi:acyl-[acyl-carrier-protein]-phospholipid O-acyltransferase/long-chain-fatty-acid--[acyl-carrier-protein] ligase
MSVFLPLVASFRHGARRRLRRTSDKGRAKRFAKVAGEMVPLGAVEDFIERLWPSSQHAVIAVPDAKRGEQLILVTTHADATRAALVGAAREGGLPEIFVPRALTRVPTLPLLGSGKVDYQRIGQLVGRLERAS